MVTALLLCAVAALSGCPIYDESAGCYRNSDCATGYLCDVGPGECYQPTSPTDGSCSKPSDCGVNETCSKAGECVSGDCTFSGCVSGYVCDSSSGKWECTSGSTGTAGASGDGGAAGAAGAPAAGGDSAAAGQAGSLP